MVVQTESKNIAQIKKLLDEYKNSLKAKGTLAEWNDSLLMKTRDKFRNLSRETRGAWTLDFYEALQKINKESLKREFE